jgi:hypothetical protein
VKRSDVCFPSVFFRKIPPGAAEHSIRRKPAMPQVVRASRTAAMRGFRSAQGQHNADTNHGDQRQKPDTRLIVKRCGAVAFAAMRGAQPQMMTTTGAMKNPAHFAGARPFNHENLLVTYMCQSALWMARSGGPSKGWSVSATI